jgi:hypothetical protein
VLVASVDAEALRTWLAVFANVRAKIDNVNDESVDEVAEAWWLYYRTFVEPERGSRRPESDAPESAHHAQDLIRDAAMDGDADVLRYLVRLAELAPDESALSFLGAGPIEDFISHCGHGNEFASRIVELARSNEPFRNALAMMWLRPDTLNADATRLLRPYVTIIGE